MTKIKFEPPIIQAIPLSPDDKLYIEGLATFNTSFITISGTAINQDNIVVNFSDELFINPINTVIRYSIALGYKFLLSVSIIDRDSSILFSDIYIRCSLLNPRSGVSSQYRKILCQGYVSGLEGISYGSSQVFPIPGDRRRLQWITISNPAAITNFTIPGRQYQNWDIEGLSFVLTTSATVGIRQLICRVANPDTNYIDFGTSRTQAASLTYKYNFTKGYPLDFQIGNNIFSSLPEIRLAYEWNLESLVQGFQAGDQLLSIYLHVLSTTTPSGT